MSKKKHILDRWEENTPQNEKEYDEGCLIAFAIIGIIFIALAAGFLLIGK